MAWFAAFIKALLEWATSEIKKDTKASDADAVPQGLKDRWRDRINKQLEKQKEQKEKHDEAKNDSNNGADV